MYFWDLQYVFFSLPYKVRGYSWSREEFWMFYLAFVYSDAADET